MAQPTETEFLLRALDTLKAKEGKVENIGASWLLSTVHACAIGTPGLGLLGSYYRMKEQSPLPNYGTEMVGGPPAATETARLLERFVVVQLQPRRATPLHKQAERIVEMLTKRWPSAVPELTNDTLQGLSTALENLYEAQRNEPPTTRAEVSARIAAKSQELLGELKRLDQANSKRMEAGELLAGHVGLGHNGRGTHLHRFGDLVREGQRRGDESLKLILNEYLATFHDEYERWLRALASLPAGILRHDPRVFLLSSHELEARAA